MPTCLFCLCGFLVFTEETYSEHNLAVGKLQLSKCDMYKVLANGSTLFGSLGSEYDIHDVNGMDSITLLERRCAL